MNSLQELNGFVGELELPFTDNRLGNVFFDRTQPNNRTQIVNEGTSFPIELGIEITEVANADVSQPVFRINVSAVFGTTVSWAQIPAGCTLTNPDVGIYEISGISSANDWQFIRQAVITIPGTSPDGFTGNWTYSCSINYFEEAVGNKSKSWTVAVTVLDVTILTNPLDFVYALDSSQTLLYTPQIIELPEYAEAEWTIVAVPSSLGSVVSFTSTYTTGGTFTFNSTTKSFTIVGTRQQVNSHLSNIVYTSTSVAVDFILSYSLTNDIDLAEDNKIQFLKNPNLLYLTNPTTFYYTEDGVNQRILNAPIITDTSYSGSDNYVLTITPSDVAAVGTLSSQGTGATVNFNNSTKVYTITGTRTEVNSHLENIFLTTQPDYADVFSLSYSVITPQLNTATKIQSMICGSNDTEITNMNITRTYVANNSNILFANNTPFISDFDTRPDLVYTIFLSSNLGQWELPTQNNPYIPGTLTGNFSLSGTKAEINAAFPTIRFYPTVGVSTSGTFTYQQQKNSVTQVTQQVALTGTSGSYVGESRSFTTSATYTPTPSDLLYGQFDLLIVGGGGGGGAVGGGGGGDLKTFTNLTFQPNTTYTITVGNGGGAGSGFYDINPPNFGYVFTPATNGGATSAFGYTADGGTSGFSPGNGNGAGVYAGTGGTTFSPSGGSIAGGGGGAGGSANATPFFDGPNGKNATTQGGGGNGGFNAGYTWFVNGSYQLINQGIFSCGGGGGTNYTNNGGSGPGSGGDGASTNRLATSGTVNQGGGGGGGRVGASPGGDGGSGLVSIRIYSR
jgi:hypothetical protein